MYKKNLSEDLRLRLSANDMDFLRKLSADRGASISEVIRSIIGEYRRASDTMEIIARTVSVISSEQEGKLSYGDTKTDFNDKL